MTPFQICMSNLYAMRGEDWKRHDIADRSLEKRHLHELREWAGLPGRMTDDGLLAMHSRERAFGPACVRVWQ